MTSALPRRRALVGAALLTLTALTASACADDRPPTLFDQRSVSVGVKNDQPGTGEEATYKFAGFDITVARHLLEGVGAKPHFNSVPSENRGQAIVDDQEDLVAATFSITPSRMKDVDFIGPYATTSQGVMIRDKDAGRIKKLEDLKGRAVCTWKGTTSFEELNKKAYGDISVYQVADASRCIADLRAGRATAVSTDQMILYGFTQKYAGLQVVPGIVVGSPNDYGIAIAKKYRADCRKLSDKLRDYLNGTDWERDFDLSLPSITKRVQNWQTEFKPSADSVGQLSCRDAPAS
ncbi:transporter substrate-binding domain-containing protein [Streptomyces benahoarensis]|uniref:Transporter substrate-binding domain-containing protein n=1 Tax=Streptomyces benahoarensis TaxID=2595054 RepID=A0A553ZGY9_9ACTN|nr:transporter substrate-binding domain-containing protein [Streptomyces benahoarensis]TSB22880.1 transporter substrate-binding domain-containing protein [Streptomyces benahoarensis]TSB40689.1 transporter substrate-binding domain-containing protein [Streptomyces benahoarensis]